MALNSFKDNSKTCHGGKPTVLHRKHFKILWKLVFAAYQNLCLETLLQHFQKLVLTAIRSFCPEFRLCISKICLSRNSTFGLEIIQRQFQNLPWLRTNSIASKLFSNNSNTSHSRKLTFAPQNIMETLPEFVLAALKLFGLENFLKKLENLS